MDSNTKMLYNISRVLEQSNTLCRFSFLSLSLTLFFSNSDKLKKELGEGGRPSSGVIMAMVTAGEGERGGFRGHGRMSSELERDPTMLR